MPAPVPLEGIPVCGTESSPSSQGLHSPGQSRWSYSEWSVEFSVVDCAGCGDIKAWREGEPGLGPRWC